MAHATVTIEYGDDLLADLRNRLDKADKRATVNAYRNDLRAIAGNGKRVYIRLQIASACASKTVDVDYSAAVANTDTLTIAGTTLAAKAVVATEDQFLIGASDALYVANVVACINAHSVLSKIVRAEAVDSNTLRITCKIPGPLGNLVTLAEAGNGFTLGGSALTGGSSDEMDDYAFGYAP